MKVFSSPTFSFLVFLLGATETSAFMGFFSNLLFAMKVCHLPGPGCHPHCHGPLKPKSMCNNECDDDRRQLSSSGQFCYTSEACDSVSSKYYSDCMAGAHDGTSTSYYDASSNADGEYSDANVSVEYEYNAYDGDESEAAHEFNSGGGSGINTTAGGHRRLSWLPYAIAGVVLTMIVAVTIRIRKKKISNPELQDAVLESGQEDLRGSVGRRIDRIESGLPVNPLDRPGTGVSFSPTEDEDEHGAGYTLA
mmetsp:Transcript_26462/g.49401  ORF Transcript_26462/g.49401 Transcript_26462/m.49401 type:complete len:250 (+) Transcript_26462:73-822(+)